MQGWAFWFKALYKPYLYQTEANFDKLHLIKSFFLKFNLTLSTLPFKHQGSLLF